MWNIIKVNNKGTRTTSLRRSGVFIVNFGQISAFILIFLSLTLSNVFAGMYFLGMKKLPSGQKMGVECSQDIHEAP